MQQVSDAPSIEGPIAGIGHNRPPVAEVFRDAYGALISEIEVLANRANTARDGLTQQKISNDNERDTWVSIGVEAGKIAQRVQKEREAVIEPLRSEIAEWNALFGTKEPVAGSLAYRLNGMKGFALQAIDQYDSAQREAARKRAAEEAEAARLEAERKLQEAAAVPADKMVTQDVALQEAAAAEHRARHLERQALAAGAGPTRTEGGTISHTTGWDFAVKDWAALDLRELRDSFSVADIEKAIRAHVRKNKDTRPLKGVEIFPNTKTQLR